MFDFEIIEHPQYVEIVCKGPGNFENLKDVVDKVASGFFPTNPKRRYLIDLRPIEGTIETLDRYNLGVYIATKLPTYKIAAISKPETYTELGENVAVNRGAHIMATYDEDQARRWLAP